MLCPVYFYPLWLRGGGCCTPPHAERGTSANRTRRVHGSTPGPGEEEEDVPSKQATLQRKINKQAASSVAPAEGEREPRGQGWRWCRQRCWLTSGRPGVSIPRIVSHRGWEQGQAPVPRAPPVWGRRPAQGQVEDGQDALCSHRPWPPRGPAGYLAARCLPSTRALLSNSN